MKTAFAFVLLAFGGVGLSANSWAVAQQPAPPYDPAYQAAAAQPNPEALPPGVANGNPAAAAAPSLPANPAVDDELLLDNGLWDGAPIGPCCAICGGGSGPPPDWYVEQDARALMRFEPREYDIGYHFATETSSSIGTEVLDTDSASPNISGIWGMTLGHYFARDTQNRDHFVEFSFWGLNNWQDEASYNGGRMSIYNSSNQKVTEQGTLYSAYAVTQATTTSGTVVNVLNGTIVPGFDRADLQTTFYSSTTNNVEINGRIIPRGPEDRLVLHSNGKWRRECQPGTYMSYLYGVRFFQLNETFRFHGESRIDTFDPTTGQLIDSQMNTGDYDIVTHNNLLGLQAGMDLTFRHCRWAWGVRSKFGPYVNFSDQVSDISAGPAGAPDFVRRLSWSKHGASLVAEVGLEGTYKFRPNLMGRVGYDFMWVSSVALAPEQLQFSTSPSNTINTNGTAFFHGITLGLEWLW